MNDKRFDRIYRKVPEPQRERLRRFRRAHPRQTRVIDGVVWEYHDAGEGDRPLLLLSGGTRGSDTSFRLVEAFERHTRVIAVGWPRITDVDPMLDGLVELMRQLGAPVFDVLGASVGGLVAQALLRRHPESIGRVVLSNTGCNEPRAQADLITERLEFASGKLALVPNFALQRLVAAQMQRLATYFPGTETAFWQAFFTERSQLDDKEDLLAFFHLLRRFTEIELPPLTEDQVPAAMLLLQSDDDVAMTPPLRAALRKRYPQAENHTFHQAGHMASLTHGAAYERVVLEFLTRPLIADESAEQ